MNLSASANLIAAAAQLQLVQSVLHAIQAADTQSAQFLAATDSHATYNNTGHGVRSDPLIVLPRDRYQPALVIHQSPLYEARPLLRGRNTPQDWQECCPKACSPQITPPPPSPWTIRPWEEPSSPPPVIKIVVREPDINGKGMLIDLFL